MHPDPLRPGDDRGDERQDTRDDAAARPAAPAGAGASDRMARFERLYRDQFGPVVSYFARRYEDPQLVADLTADTFVAAIHAFRSYHPEQMRPRAWAIGIARRIDARYRNSDPREEDPQRPRSMPTLLDRTETRELRWRIELERSSRDLIDRIRAMPDLDRDAFELVELCELSHAEAASELGLSGAALRVRLLRARTRMRREGQHEL